MLNSYPDNNRGILRHDPFGMLATGRNWEVGSGYRYGFNSQEQELDLNSIGNIYTAEFWEYDSRLGRRWNKDPILTFDLSPYAVLANNPILSADVNGDVVEIRGKTKREKKKTERLINKAIKRDAEFAKIHQERIEDTENTYVYDWDKDNSASLNSQTALAAPAGKDQVVDNKAPNTYWVEFGTIDPKYKYYRIQVYQNFYQTVNVQFGSTKSSTSTYTTSIPTEYFSEWSTTPFNAFDLVKANGNCGSTCSSTSVTATIDAWAHERHSTGPDGSWEEWNYGYETVSITWVAMSIPITVKAPKGNLNNQFKKGNVTIHPLTGSETVIINRKSETGAFKIPYYLGGNIF